MEDDVKVSIICLVFNHEQYLRQCLDGFIMQKTDFKYEVLIHDDASTDSSADIIREYEKEYPDIIKPIYQKVNQYSQGINIENTFIYPIAKGKYLAYCEGDDKWIDRNKLQMQVDYMEKHEDCGITVHQALINNIREKTIKLCNACQTEKDFTTNEVVVGGGAFFATSSIMLRKHDLLRMPDCYWVKGFGDFQLVIYGSICGKCHYFPIPMSQYNLGTSGSWSERSSNINESIKMKKKVIALMERLRQFYNYEYEGMDYFIRWKTYELNKLEKNRKELLKKQYRAFLAADIKSAIYIKLKGTVNGLKK